MKTVLKKINIFTVLTAFIVLSLGFRLNTLVDNFKKDGKVTIVASAIAVEKAHDDSAPDKTPEAEAVLNEMKANADLTAEDRIQADRGLPEFPVMTFSETEIEVLQSLSKRRQDLETREKRIAHREALLNAAEQGVDAKITELAALRTEIEKLLGQQKKVQESRLQSMVKVYETMKPDEAAEIFNTLDMDVLLAVLSRMSERRSAPIFASMNPERARQVTIRLVEQSQLPSLDMPKEN